MKPAQLRSLLKLLRSQGVVSYKHDGLELLLDPNFKSEVLEPPKHIPGQLASELNKASPGFFGMTDDQLAVYSSEGTRES